MNSLFTFPARDPKSLNIPLYCDLIKAGFPSPADDYSDSSLDFNEYLVKNKAATFVVRVQGDSMSGAGINTGDLLVVDRSVKPANNSIIVAIVSGEFTVKRLTKELGRYYLCPENPDYPVIEISEEMEFQVWGVVTYAIHSLL
ncbi:MAG: translesion error-prone DNA polymerase V autoproteolytic subunit [Spirochaetaceae bacterium]|nr:translesion error-prone DNA polymerase V autoproteolytic subunit [Spirochaetaceae bacterium]